ncbi:MAG: hypothetical protein IJZ35_08410 [Clostridia bacterium]|nr:hypothetical protein [Clostridia bacterium]
MKKALIRLVSFITTVALIITAVPFYTFAQSVSFDRIVNAAIYIIVYNEGNYTTVIKNDNGALSLGKICWHGTNALNLLKEIVAKNPSQAQSILGSSLYNEIVTSSSWDSRKATSAEASTLSILLATAESREIQDESAYEYVSGYVQLGQALGITEAQALVFFADYANQNGRTGAANYCQRVINTYGEATLGTLFDASSQSARRTRTYNFCATINWDDYGDEPEEADTIPPEITNVKVSDITTSGFSVSCDTTDNGDLIVVFIAVHHQDDSTDNASWYAQNPIDNKATHTVDISDFSNRSGNYCVYIYSFDESGNYTYVVLNPVNVPAATVAPEFTGTVYSNNASFIGEEIVWNASASGGSGHYLYQFTLYRNGKKIAERRYSDYSVFKYTAEESGVYSLEVSVSDSVSGKITACTSADINIYKPIIIDSLNASADRLYTGKTVSWEINAHGGEGDLQYAYTVYKDSEAVYSTASYSPDNRFTYKTSESGTYSVTVNIKDSSSQVISVSSDEITVYDPMAVTEVSFSDNYAVTGMSVTCTADITGGTGEYSCVFDIYRNGVILLSSEEISTNEFTFTVPDSGTYTATVTVTDADSTQVTAVSGALTAEDTAKRGDTNCDGEITAADARLALRHSAQLEILPLLNQSSADVNNDGEITASDARTILRMSCGLE